MKLTNVYYEGTIFDWCNIEFDFAYANPMCYARHLFMISNNNNFKELSGIITIPDSVTKIGNCQFMGFKNMDGIVLSDSVTSIGESAFEDCQGLKNIVLSNNLKLIDKSTFANCTSLKSIILPKSINDMGRGVFEGCVDLVVKCEAPYKLGQWSVDWIAKNIEVIWDYKEE